jgi:hypothetical protein
MSRTVFTALLLTAVLLALVGAVAQLARGERPPLLS